MHVAWIWVIGIASAAGTVLGPHYARRLGAHLLASTPALAPEPRTDGSYAMGAYLAEPDLATKQLRKARRGVVVLDRRALTWEPKSGHGWTIKLESLTPAALVPLTRVLGENAGSAYGAWFTGPAGRIQIRADSSERGGKMGLARPAGRTDRYNAALMDLVIRHRESLTRPRRPL